MSDPVCYQAFTQGANKRNATANGSLKSDADLLFPGYREQLTAMNSQQSFVGGDHVFASFHRLQNEGLGWLHASYELHNNLNFLIRQNVLYLGGKNFLWKRDLSRSFQSRSISTTLLSLSGTPSRS